MKKFTKEDLQPYFEKKAVIKTANREYAGTITTFSKHTFSFYTVEGGYAVNYALNYSDITDIR